MPTNIHWFRNDLRIKDNKALSYATQNGKTLPIFILNNKLQKISNPKRLAFLYFSLKELKENLQIIGSDLVILNGDFEDELLKLCKKANTQKLYFNREYTPYSRNRDQKVYELLKENSIEIESFKDNVIFEKLEIAKNDNTPYKVFTAYKTNWLAQLKNRISELNISNIEENNLFSKDEIIGLNIQQVDINKLCAEYEPELSKHFKPGENEAENRWNSFFDNKIQNYKNNRDILGSKDFTYTSAMSPYIKFGNISVREIVRDCIKNLGNDFDDFRTLTNIEDKKDVETFLSEIIWRDFYKMIIYNFPTSATKCFQEKYENIRWENDKSKFKKWCNGETGYPIVDAAMREMNSIGWMHNRSRMIVASFLCKDLHIDWKWGERYFFEKLIDYDISSNVGGWQWTAGTGTDAAPYFRIFNPIEQGKKFDKNGYYVKKFIPELDNIPEKYIHEPWLFDKNAYLERIVEHANARKIALEMYGEVKN